MLLRTAFLVSFMCFASDVWAQLVDPAPLCPDRAADLKPWSAPGSWDSGTLPAPGSIVNIDRPILLDMTYIAVSEINIFGSGRLVFSDQVGDILVDIDSKGILVRDTGSLIIGGEKCRFQNNVHIKLNGTRTTSRELLGSKGEKYIAVQDQGSLHIYGQDKLSWTKLSNTAERWTVDKYKIAYNHATSSYSRAGIFSNGAAMYIFHGDILRPVFYKVFDFDVRGGGTLREQRRVHAMTKTLRGVLDGEVVAIAIQRGFKTTADLEGLFTLLEDITSVPRIGLRDCYETDAYALVFQLGGTYNEALVPAIGKTSLIARAHLVIGDRKVEAISHMNSAMSGRFVEFRVIDASIGFPTISVVDNISSWKVGDEVILTSTDYSREHTELRTILEIASPHSIKLSDELEYRHFGEIEDGVDMRGEVALLTRNIKIEGVMIRGCPKGNENCNEFDYDTYGAHTKIDGFHSVHIEGVEFVNVGQGTDRGFYPIHVHMCYDVSDREAVIKANSIHNSYARAVTVHAVWGQTQEKLGLKVSNNVAYDISGHAYFLEDGSERATLFDGNLGATIKSVPGQLATDKTGPVVFWITNPKVILTNNVAVGAKGFGYWYVFPNEPQGHSAMMGVYQKKEARFTPLWTFDNNIAHSNLGGLRFDNRLENEEGKVGGCMNYKPLVNPLDRESDYAKVQITRFTAYKNENVNAWLRGGWFEIIQFSSAESRRGIQIARGSSQQQFVTKSIMIGKSKGNSEDHDYPDVPDLPHFLGVVFHDGPIHIDKTWFNGFKTVEGQYVAGALGFSPHNKRTSSIASNSTDLRFGFEDKADGSGGNRVFDGTETDKLYGFGNFDGDESATFRDGDGSVTRCPGHNWSRPIQVVKPEKYIILDNCKARANWQMVICENNYGKIAVDVLQYFKTADAELLRETQARRLDRLDPSDVAYEDHSGERAAEFMTVLGSSEHYYQLQFLKDFPRKVRFTAKGVERDYPVVAGVCLPEGLTLTDINLFGWRPPAVETPADGWIVVDTMEELFQDETMTRVFQEGRFLYVKLMNTLTRYPHWDKWDTDHCPSGHCPYFTLEVLKDEIANYTPCFKPTQGELNTDVHLHNIPEMICSLPASLPEPDWGAGDTMRTAVEGEWGEWSSWSDCCEHLDHQTFRYRVCDYPTPFGLAAECSGISHENQTCTTKCPENGQLSEWSRWSDCFCDGIAAGSSGASTRKRACDVSENGEFCQGALTEVKSCYGNCE